LPFDLIVIGEKFAEVPPIFEEAKLKLSSHIKRWGFVESKKEYMFILENLVDVVVSTTDHEFFGVSVIEAIAHGCYPLCPNRVVFPEYLPDEFLYNTEAQLSKKLRYFVRYPEKLRQANWNIDLAKFDWKTLQPSYSEIFN